jgi:hypothetical protein
MYMFPPEYYQVRDNQGVLRLINRWAIAHVEIHGVEGILTRARPNSSELNVSSIDQDRLQVTIYCTAAPPAELAGGQALLFLQSYYHHSHSLTQPPENGG